MEWFLQLRDARIERFLGLPWKVQVASTVAICEWFLSSPANRKSTTNTEEECNKILLKDLWNSCIEANECYETFVQNERDERNFFVNFSVRS